MHSHPAEEEVANVMLNINLLQPTVYGPKNALRSVCVSVSVCAGQRGTRWQLLHEDVFSTWFGLFLSILEAIRLTWRKFYLASQDVSV